VIDRIWNNHKIDKGFAKYVAGKSIAVVAPGPSIAGSRQADIINRHDIVVRFNRSLPVSKEMADDTGERCEVLYHCGNEAMISGGPVKVSEIKGIDWFCLGHNLRWRNPWRCISMEMPIVTKLERAKVKVHVTPVAVSDAIWFGCRTTPNVGTMAIFDLLHHGAAKVYVAGVSFRHGYGNGYKSDIDAAKLEAQHPGHDMERQRRFVAHMLRGDDRLTGDHAFMEAICR
jgi:hypothetical protein